MINRTEEFRNITTVMADTYERKNNDYGSSFGNIRAKYPNAILIRLNDKLSRIETLLGGATQKVMDESINDTLLDLAVYAIMELVERKQDEEYKAIIKKEGDKDVHASTCTHGIQSIGRNVQNQGTNIQG